MVERQVAVAVVVAVEEPAFLVTVQRVIGGVEIEHDLARRRVVGFQEQVDEQSFDRLRLVADLVVARRLPDPAELQSVERRLAGKHRAILPLRRQAFRHKGQNGVVAERVVVVDVLISQRDRRDALSHQRLYAVHRAVRIASVDEAGSHPAEQPDDFVNVAHKQGAGI